mmetsp:Transcript_61957/g.138355  ORF Transcript_61957/g.138355 Transcript_61957/m.138355 type:complete len:558 (+) Transcript_61957:121-1794(+)
MPEHLFPLVAMPQPECPGPGDAKEPPNPPPSLQIPAKPVCASTASQGHVESLEDLLQAQREDVLRSGSLVIGRPCSREKGQEPEPDQALSSVDHPFAPSLAGRANTPFGPSLVGRASSEPSLLSPGSNIDPNSSLVPMRARAEAAEQGCYSIPMSAVRSRQERERLKSFLSLDIEKGGCVEHKAYGKEKEEEHVRCYDQGAEELTGIFFLVFGLASSRLKQWPFSVALCAGVMNMSAIVASVLSATPSGLGTGLLAIHVSESFVSMVLLWKIGASTTFAQFLTQHCHESPTEMQTRNAWIASAKLHVCLLCVCLSLSFGIMVTQAKIANTHSLGLPSANAALWIWSSVYRNLYRGSWALCILRINKMLTLFVDGFARQHKQDPSSVDTSWQQWTCLTALAGQASDHAGPVYIFLLAFPLFKMAAGLGSMLTGEVPGPGSMELSLPVLCAGIVEVLVPLSVLRSAAAVCKKCQDAISFINSFQVDLPCSVRVSHTDFVAHMANSNAGISACGVKLTSALLLKVASASLTVMAFMAQRLLAQQAGLGEQLDAIRKALTS